MITDPSLITNRSTVSESETLEIQKTTCAVERANVSEDGIIPSTRTPPSILRARLRCITAQTIESLEVSCQERHPFEEQKPSKTSILAEFAGIAGYTQRQLITVAHAWVLYELPETHPHVCAALPRSCLIKAAGRRSQPPPLQRAIPAMISIACAAARNKLSKCQPIPFSQPGSLSCLLGDRPSGAGVVWPAVAAHVAGNLEPSRAASRLADARIGGGRTLWLGRSHSRRAARSCTCARVDLLCTAGCTRRRPHSVGIH